MKVGKLTSKKKLYGLMLGSIVFFILGWHFSFSKTVNELQRYKTLKNKFERAEGIDEKILQVRSRLATMKGAGIPMGSNATDQKHESMLTLTSSLADENKVTVIELPAEEVSSDNNFVIHTNEFAVAGGYHAILGLLHSLEMSNSSGRIVSVQFKLEEDRRTKNRNLIATIVTRSVKNIGYDKVGQ